MSISHVYHFVQFGKINNLLVENHINMYYNYIKLHKLKILHI